MDEEVFYDAEEDACQQRTPGTEFTGSVYSLHKAAYENDAVQLDALLQQLPVSVRTSLDPHGNNPLHVAALRGNTEAVRVLLAAGLSPATRSSRGWTPLDEALAAKAIPAARLLQRKLLSDAKSEMKVKRAQLLDSMRAMPDYSLQLKWQLGSSVPGLGMLLRRYAPHDTYTIWKVGDKLRVDGSLMGIDTTNLMPEWKRGHFSLVVDGSPEGIAAAAEAAAAAIAAASAAAEAKQQAKQETRQDKQHQQQQQQEGEQQQVSAAANGAGSSSSSQQGAAAAAGNGNGSNDNGEQQFYDADEQQQAAASSSSSSSSRAASSSSAAAAGTSIAAAGSSPSPSAAAAAAAGTSTAAAAAAGPSAAVSGGPRLLFLNHVKASWLDLSADKKALKLEGRGEEEEADGELAAAMERDVDKLRLKPRDFKFAPVKGWLGGVFGGHTTEKVEGWKCTVYEATGKLLAVNTSKARLHLPPGATFYDYLAAEYEADAVTETLIDPLSPSGVGMMGDSSSSSSSGGKQPAGSSSRDGSRDGSVRGSGGYGGQGDGAGDEDYDALMWNGPDSASRKSSKKAGSSGKAGDGSAAAAAAAGVGRVLKARCWMAQEFPMRLSQLLPLLDVIGTANKHMAKVGKFLAKYSQMDMFPVKLQVPLLLTVYVLVSFKAFHPLVPGSPHPPPAEEFFDVPLSYKRKLLSEVVDKAAANMMGVGRGRDEGGSEGGSVFYGGDEGQELLLAGEDEETAVGGGSASGSGSSSAGRG